AFPRPVRLEDRLLEWAHFHVEPVVLVRRLAFEGAPGATDALPVDDDWRARRDRDFVIVLHPIDRDLEVEFSHPGDEVLAGLLVALDLDAGIRLREDPEPLHERREVRGGLGLARAR